MPNRVGEHLPDDGEEKVDMMQRHLFRGKQVKIGGLSMEEM